MKTNVPEVVFLDTGNEKFYKGDYVRMLMKNKNEYIGTLCEINANSIAVKTNDASIVKADVENIAKIKKVDKNESFNDVPYFDEEEKEFWKNHWITRDGIQEKTPEDIKRSYEFFQKGVSHA